MKMLMSVAMAATLLLPELAGAREYCGNLANHYGPFDYRHAENLKLVEDAHFTEDVESGIRGNTADFIGGDLDYTLRVFPNHHRALATLARVALRDNTLFIPHTKWPVECYFLRAQRFRPDDAMVYATYGSFLFGLGKFDKALGEFKQAVSLDPDNAMINYNLGLVYLKKNDFAHANEHAHKAYDKGYPLPGLKNQLVKAGKWVDSAPADGKPADGKSDD